MNSFGFLLYVRKVYQKPGIQFPEVEPKFKDKHSAGDPRSCAVCNSLGYSGPFVWDTGRRSQLIAKIWEKVVQELLNLKLKLRVFYYLLLL